MKKHMTKKEKKAERKDVLHLTDENGEVIRTITLTPTRRGCAMYISSTKWGERTAADFCAAAVRAHSIAMAEQLNMLYALDPARADAVMDELDAEADG